jgi:hypothetical protein
MNTVAIWESKEKEIKGLMLPEILLSGNGTAIKKCFTQKSLHTGMTEN